MVPSICLTQLKTRSRERWHGWKVRSFITSFLISFLWTFASSHACCYISSSSIYMYVNTVMTRCLKVQEFFSSEQWYHVACADASSLLLTGWHVDRRRNPVPGGVDGAGAGVVGRQDDVQRVVVRSRRERDRRWFRGKQSNRQSSLHGHWHSWSWSILDSYFFGFVAIFLMKYSQHIFIYFKSLNYICSFNVFIM